jgi:uncharacterized protein (TIGR02145 family)
MKIMKKLLLTLALALVTTVSFAQVGIGTTTTTPAPSSILDLGSTTKGFLPPRMSTAERDVINSGVWAEGLTIYNTDTKSLELHNGTDWISVFNGSVVSTIPQSIPDNATCASATISANPCTQDELDNGINGGSLGNKYDNTNGGTYSVVDIAGQCWMQENIDVDPAGSPTWANATDVGWYGYYSTTYQAAGEGTLLQWSAAMNGATTERAQGVCPTDWHIPSDCEWMYLENTLGMTTAEQQLTGLRNSGTVGSKLSTLTSGGTNSSGFTALLAGIRINLGPFVIRGVNGFWWSSSEASATKAPYRKLSSGQTGQVGVIRTSDSKASALSVRCLKD